MLSCSKTSLRCFSSDFFFPVKTNLSIETFLCLLTFCSKCGHLFLEMRDNHCMNLCTAGSLDQVVHLPDCRESRKPSHVAKEVGLELEFYFLRLVLDLFRFKKVPITRKLQRLVPKTSHINPAHLEIFKPMFQIMFTSGLPSILERDHMSAPYTLISCWWFIMSALFRMIRILSSCWRIDSMACLNSSDMSNL